MPITTYEIYALGTETPASVERNAESAGISAQRMANVFDIDFYVYSRVAGERELRFAGSYSPAFINRD